MKMLSTFMSNNWLLGSAIVFCKNKHDRSGEPVSVASLMDMDNDIRARTNKPLLHDNEPNLYGVQEFHAGVEITRDARLRMMRRFRENKAKILVATDAVAKGIDVPNVTMVVQMELVMSGKERGGFLWIKTQNKALDQFRHRSGRTARALQKGINVVMVTPSEEAKAQEYMRILSVQPQNLKVVRADQFDMEELRDYVEAAQH